ncbi:MAG: glycosyltransferase [Actinophytocola sp.]|uniref:glycosyltransferase n=1 Tax=Actinophytocola sp. TaxID=1872138 RepID=UPI003D6A993B
MRFLVTSTAGAGHYGPLAPFVRSFMDGGHDVLVAGPPGLRASVAGAEFWAVDDPPADELAAAFARAWSLSHDEANALVVSEVFGRLDATAAVPRLREAITSWRPDLVVRETAEFGGAVAAELHGLPHARVAIGLGTMERALTDVAAPNVDVLRHAYGLAGPHRLHEAPHLTLFPAGLEDADGRPLRFRDPSWRAAEPRPVPLVYVTFGSVAGGMSMLADVFAAALAAVADLDAEVVLSVGRDADPASFGPAPPHVRIERWVNQAEVLAGASAIVCHGGGGSTLGALAAGVPLVVVPLFAQDQHANAERVAAVGAGVRTEPPGIRAALDAVLTEPSYRAAARLLAAELAAHPSTDEAADALAAHWSGVDR